MFKDVTDKQLPLLERALNSERNVIQRQIEYAGPRHNLNLLIVEGFKEQLDEVKTMLYEAEEEAARRYALRTGREYSRVSYADWENHNFGGKS